MSKIKMNIPVRVDQRRGCGYRKEKGLYLVGLPLNAPCCKLPFPLTVCPTCGEGIRTSRAWTWVDVGHLFGQEPCAENKTGAYHCCLENPSKLGKVGLIWVGEQFYPTPHEFLKEAVAQGVSRRITAVPKDFKIGESWVLLGHRKGIMITKVTSVKEWDGESLKDTGDSIAINNYKPAIFSVFKPIAVEYITKGDETEEQLEGMVKRGITPVKVEYHRHAQTSSAEEK